MKYYIFEIHNVDGFCDDIPREKCEWWEMRHSAPTKEQALDWVSQFRTKNSKYKLVSSALSLKQSFFPRAEVKTKTHTSRFLKQINYC